MQRDAQIAADRAAGRSWPSIAADHDISERQARRAARSHWEGASGLTEHDPVEAVLEALAQVDAIAERFARLAAEATHDAVVVGALKGQLGAIRERLALMQAVGLLPLDLGLLRRDIHAREFAEETMRVLREHNVDQSVLLALRDAYASRQLVRTNGNASFRGPDAQGPG